jgi:hypothetical protein
MLTAIHPKLPMRNKVITRQFYLEKLDFKEVGNADYDGYLMVQKDSVQIHFFEFRELDPKENYGQVYIRTDNIERQYQLAVEKKLSMPEAGHLQIKPWQQKEFSLLDPDNNLLTFGQSILGNIINNTKPQTCSFPHVCGIIFFCHYLPCPQLPGLITNNWYAFPET